MVKMNLRIVKPGRNLYLWARQAKIMPHGASIEVLEKVCNHFAKRGLGAVYCRERDQILVFTQNTISPLTVRGDNWIVEIEDSGEKQCFRFSHSGNDARLLARLIERHVLLEIKRRLPLRTINSPRILYESEPFQSAEGIDAYRRFEVSTVPIEDVGVGILVDVGVAFFTEWTVADFFRDDFSKDKQEYRQRRFDSLSQRQAEQKGTLLYDSGNYLSSCYFDDFSNGITCATTGKRIVKGEVYDSLLDYYQNRQPHLEIHPDDCVAMVSFKGIAHPQPVAAKLLRLRVMNDSLPRSLKQIDKLTPEDRSKFIERFWKDAGSDLLGCGKPPVAQHFWSPVKERIIELLPPRLQFANQMTLSAPQRRNFIEFRDYYRKRLPLLRKEGCLETSKLMENVVHFAIPTKTTQEMRGNLIKDLTEHLKRLTNKAITPKLVRYESLDEAFSTLKQHKMPGMVVFVFDDESSETYYKVSNELHNWRIKRITFRELKSKFSKLELRINQGGQLPKAEKDWNSFIEMIVLDVLQLMDCVPWGFKDKLPYDAHLAIDVGRDKRYYALSLLIFHPFPRIYTVVLPKPDITKETINHIFLNEKIIDLCNDASIPNDFQRFRSLLVLRDGRESGNELKAIKAAENELITNGILESDAVVDIVDFHKSSLKRPRFWEAMQGNRVEQILEGTAICWDNRTAVLVTTGAPTLHQGTAIPVLLEARSENVNMKRVIESVYASTQLNFSNPNVSQRLPLELKRTDDELKNRDSQEIRRTR